MSDLGNYYLEKQRAQEALESQKDNEKLMFYLRAISRIAPSVLDMIIHNPPSDCIWVTVENTQYVGWKFNGYSFIPGDDESRREYFYLLEDGRIFIGDFFKAYDQLFDIKKNHYYEPEGIGTIHFECLADGLVKLAISLGAPDDSISEFNSYLGRYKKEEEKSDSCYIATAVYGSYEAPEVQVLRKFRDEVLQNSSFGRLFISTYYKLSPPVAERLKDAQRSNRFVKSLLNRWVERLRNTRGY